MDEISTRYIIIAVGIFITLIVFTSIMLVINNVGDVFSIVNKTNISIQSRIDSIENMYDGITTNGVGLVNTIAKYENDDNIKIEYPHIDDIENDAGSDNILLYLRKKLDEGTLSYWEYQSIFSASVIKSGSVYTIEFEII